MVPAAKKIYIFFLVSEVFAVQRKDSCSSESDIFIKTKTSKEVFGEEGGNFKQRDVNKCEKKRLNCWSSGYHCNLVYLTS